MKKHFILFSTFAALLLSATLLTACGEDVQESADNGNNGETVAETTVGENCTLFSTGDDGTRTALGYDRKFYWSEGDQIYVNTDGANYKKTSSSTLSSDKRTADFVLEGVQLTHSPCSVMYIGNGTTAATATKNDLKVKIEATQTQAAWGDTAHIGRAGDCGVAEATKEGGKYTFNLRHKAAYLVFQPYKDAQITTDWKLIKIEIITDGTTKVAGEYPFGTGELDVANATNTTDTVGLYCNSTTSYPSYEYYKYDYIPSPDPELEDEEIITGPFYETIPNAIATGGFAIGSSSSAANSCFAVIAPGDHKLTIRYTIQPQIGTFCHFVYKEPEFIQGATFTIDKEIPAVNPDGSRTYNPNSVTIIKHKLDAMLFTPQYYQWDALNPYTSATGAEYNNSITWPTNASEIAAQSAKQSCKDMPNVNEYYWYVMNGDWHYDTTTPWTIDGGKKVYTGGWWGKTRTTILTEGNTFRDDIGMKGYDLRLVNDGHEVHYSYNTTHIKPKRGKPANISNYFYLPALGWGGPSVYPVGSIQHIGTNAIFWSSSPVPRDNDNSYAFYIGLSEYNVCVALTIRKYYFVAGAQWFK